MALAGATKVVAIVEDDASLLRSLERLLNTLGFDTKSYASAEAFLSDATGSEPRCLITDIKLPGISGIELRRQLSASGSRVSVIFMTSFDDENLKNEALATGCIAYLQKPFAASALVEAIGRCAH